MHLAVALALALAVPPQDRVRPSELEPRNEPPRREAPRANPDAPRTPAPAKYPPVTRMAKGRPPPLPEPELGDWAPFADLGTSVTRASNRPHHYAKTPVWNADETLAMTNDGRILDGDTYVHLRTVKLPNEHKTWSNTDPRYVYGVNKAQRQWVRVDAARGGNVVLAVYREYRTVSFGEYEGNLDNGDTGAVLVGDGKVPFVIDPKSGAVRCTVRGGGGFGRGVSDATMSQDGAHALVNWSGHGIDAYDAATCGFARNLTRRNSHYDACVSAAREQVVVQPGEPGALVMTRIADGAQTTVYRDGALRMHVSCRNTQRPGWAYISHENVTCDAALRGMESYGRIFALKLDGSQDVEVYAWDHQSCPAPYAANPMAVPSRAGNRIWFKARWDGTSTAVHSFVAERR